MEGDSPAQEIEPEPVERIRPQKLSIHCDRCGAEMIASRCKIVCLNCGSRMDCSDLSIYMDE